MAIIYTSPSRRVWIYTLIAAPIALLLLLSLTKPSLPGQARDYVASHLPLHTDTPVIDSLASQLEGSPKQESESLGHGPAHGHEPEKVVSAVPEVPSYLPSVVASAAPNEASELAIATIVTPLPTETPAYDPLKWFYQYDIEGYDLPDFQVDISNLRHYAPHNYKGHGQDVYATFFATREGTLKDPYFLSALQIVYRLLWDPKIKGDKPVVVFVPPFVPEPQRAYFAATGAVVRELDVRDFTPTNRGVIPERLKDMFTKLEMWRHTDFNRIMYLDSDAIPFKNLEYIWTITQSQQCRMNRLPAVDRRYAEICNYVFAAWPEIDHGMLNAGVMVFKPTAPMYERLIRESTKPHKQREWDDGIMEQAFLNAMFNWESPFPSRNLTYEWNGDIHEQGLNPRIMHGKIWAQSYGNITVPEELKWIVRNYNDTWGELKRFYESGDFVRAREADRDAVTGGPLNAAPQNTEQPLQQDDTEPKSKVELSKEDVDEVPQQGQGPSVGKQQLKAPKKKAKGTKKPAGS